MPVEIYKSKLVDALIDGKTIRRNSVNRMYLPFYIKSMGTASVSAGSSYVNVTDSDDDADYVVLVETSWNTTVYISSKTASGFRVNFGTAPTTASTIRWVKVRMS